MKIQIRTSQGGILNVASDDPEVEAHFARPESFTDAILNQINQSRIYDPYFVGRIDLTFLDLGANVGLVSLYAQDACKRIVAVEPHPGHFAILQKLTRRFKPIEPLNVAVAPVTGPIKLYLKPDNTTMHSLVGSTYGSIVVPGMKLFDLLASQSLTMVDLCKVDIEGSEMMSITPEELDACRPHIRSYFMECHPGGECEYIRKHFESMFAGAGYSVKTLSCDSFYAKR